MSAEDFKIVHFIPGRIRARVERIKRDHGFCEKIQTEISSLDAITKVEINQTTGSILILYDKVSIKKPDMIQKLKTVIGELFPSVDVNSLETWLTKY